MVGGKMTATPSCFTTLDKRGFIINGKNQYNTLMEDCLKRQELVKQDFAKCTSEEEKYQKIIALGRAMTPLASTAKTAENVVKGCQSTMYLLSTYRDGKVFFEAESDALISSGLASLLIQVYSGEPPETILKCPPNYLEEIGITASLTPNRANGLYSIHLRMKQDALRFLMGR